MAAPLADPAALDDVWRAAGAGPLCVAVSGGGDSLALLALLRSHAPDRAIMALVVDHAIQPHSAAVAKEAASRARALGAQAQILTLSWRPKAAPVDHARARAARYRALAKAMRRLDARVLALGHTLDDQAETVLIKHARLGAWSHAAGMAALSPVPQWPFGYGLWAARPLLGVRRAALRAFLQDQGIKWRDDPANNEPRYLRARARQLIEVGAVDGGRLGQFAALLRCRQDRRAAIAYEALRARARIAAGTAWFDPDLNNPADLRALAALWAAVGGKAKAPPPAALVRALQGKAATLGGVLMRAQDGGVYLRAEGRRQPVHFRERARDRNDFCTGRPVLVESRAVVTAPHFGAPVQDRLSNPYDVGAYIEDISLQDSDSVLVTWLTEQHLRHHLAPGDPFISCDGEEGVQQALGLLS